MRKIYNFLLTIHDKLLKLILSLCEFSNISYVRSIISFIPICFLLVIFVAYSLPFFVIQLIINFFWRNSDEPEENNKTL